MRTLTRWSPMAAALLAVAAMGLLSFTSLASRLEGSPDTPYPAIIFMTIGLPSALVALAAGVLTALRPKRRPPRLGLTFLAVCLLALLICALLTATLFLPDAVLSALPDGFVASLFLAWPVLLVVLIAGVVLGLLTGKASPVGD